MSRASPDAPPRPRWLKRRSQFLAANDGARAPTPGFVLLVKPRGDGDPAMAAGLTVSRKVGNAVTRNRMKRRLRALVREVMPQAGVAGADHVLIGRAGGIERDFRTLRDELARGLKRASSPSPRHSSESRDPVRRGI